MGLGVAARTQHGDHRRDLVWQTARPNWPNASPNISCRTAASSTAASGSIPPRAAGDDDMDIFQSENHIVGFSVEGASRPGLAAAGRRQPETSRSASYFGVKRCAPSRRITSPLT